MYQLNIDLFTLLDNNIIMIGDPNVCYFTLQDGNIAQYADEQVTIVKMPVFIETIKLVNKCAFVASKGTDHYVIFPCLRKDKFTKPEIVPITEHLCTGLECEPEDIKIDDGIIVKDTLVQIDETSKLVVLETVFKKFYRYGIAVDVYDELYALTHYKDGDIFDKICCYHTLDIKDVVGRDCPHILTASGDVWIVKMKPKGYPTICKSKLENVHKICCMSDYHVFVFLMRCGKVYIKTSNELELISNEATNIFSSPNKFVIAYQTKLDIYDNMTFVKQVEYDKPIKDIHVMDLCVLVSLVDGSVYEITDESKKLDIFDDNPIVAFRNPMTKR